jgi:DNA-binding protein YbaB
MSILDAKDDAAALQPLVTNAVNEALAGLADKVAPAIGTALQGALDGLTITVTVNVARKATP